MSDALLQNTGDFIVPYFKEVCEKVLTYKDHKAHLVYETVISLLPKLATTSPTAFAQVYFEACVQHLFKTLGSNLYSHGAAFLALGEMAVVCMYICI